MAPEARGPWEKVWVLQPSGEERLVENDSGEERKTKERTWRVKEAAERDLLIRLSGGRIREKRAHSLQSDYYMKRIENMS